MTMPDFGAMGIVQLGDPILVQPAKEYDPETDADLIKEHWALLVAAVETIEANYEVVKGIGVAGPQIGIPYKIAIIKSMDGTIYPLINPKTTWKSEATDLKPEGCLSFFDIRVNVERPLRIIVETLDLDMNVVELDLKNADARLEQHEEDHVNGVIIKDHAHGTDDIIPYEIYVMTARKAWEYPDQGLSR